MKRTIFTAALFLSLSPALIGCSGGGGGGSSSPQCTAPAAPAGLAATRIVSASAGSDASASGACVAYKTITAALAAATAGDVVWVAPGTYDAANGEVFPITIPAGVSLIGDVSNKGNGTTPTLIKGHGTAVSGTYPAYSALVTAATSTVSGFEFDDSVFTVMSFGVYANNATMAATDNTFLSTLYGGVDISSGGNPVMQSNAFNNYAYGVYSSCTGTAVIRNNTFTDNSIPLDNVMGNALIQNNTFSRSGSGSTGVQVEHGSPSIKNNTFSASGYTYAALNAMLAGSPIVRGNTFTIGTGPAVKTSDTAAPDLGTAADAGNNIFSSVTGTVILHTSSATISAIGNTWPVNPPSCSSTIVVSGAGAGTVVWGSTAGNQCP